MAWPSSPSSNRTSCSRYSRSWSRSETISSSLALRSRNSDSARRRSRYGLDALRLKNVNLTLPPLFILRYDVSLALDQQCGRLRGDTLATARETELLRGLA